MVLFLDEFPAIHQSTHGVLIWIDFALIIYFLIEAIIKIGIKGFKGYWQNSWNRIDFVIVMLCLPALLTPFLDMQFFAVLMVFRLGRLLRFFRIVRFVPNALHLVSGIKRSLKASVGVFLALFILNLAFGMGATILFGDTAPEYFGDPLISVYSLFKVFTIEGWFEIPDALAANGTSATRVGLVRAYFVVAVVIGGILGLSLANAVFVDEMTADNTERVERMVADLHSEVKTMQQAQQADQQAMMTAIQAQLGELRDMMDQMRSGQDNGDRD